MPPARPSPADAGAPRVVAAPPHALPADPALGPALFALLGQSLQACALFDVDDVLRYANPAFQRLFAVPALHLTWEALMRHARAVGVGTRVEAADFDHWLRAARSRRGKLPYRAFESELVDGRWILMAETTLPDGWMLCCATEVSDLRVETRHLRAERDRARREAWTDDLTGLSNRRHLTDRLRETLARAGHGDAAVMVALFDLDHFKRLNDVHGHDVGDRVLCDFALLLQAGVRREDLAGRLGGEEFVVAVGSDDATHLPELVERVLQAVRRSTPVPALPSLRYTASAGIAASQPGDDVATLLKRADAALYAAKAAGRDGWRQAVPDPMRPPDIAAPPPPPLPPSAQDA